MAVVIGMPRVIMTGRVGVGVAGRMIMGIGFGVSHLVVLAGRVDMLYCYISWDQDPLASMP